MWQTLIPLGLKFGADYLAGKKSEDAQDRADRANNARSLREYNARMQEEFANQAAQNEYLAALSKAGETGLAGRSEAFSMMKAADAEEQEARDNLAAAIKQFGKTSKEANVAAAKAKRSGRVAKAIKGANVKGTGGAGRKGIQSALGKARATGLNRAADTGAMAAGLGAYGADLSREMGVYNDLAAENAALGNYAKWGRQTAGERERLANQDAATMRSVAGTKKANQVMRNRALGPSHLPFDPQVRISPNNTGLRAFSAAMGAMNGYKGKMPWHVQDQGSVPITGPELYYGKQYPGGGY